MAQTADKPFVSEKYRITTILGQGAMGVVYSAEQRDTEGHELRKVAIKVMRSSLSHDPSLRARFLREIRVAAELKGSRFVALYDCGETTEGLLYYVMELIAGCSLREYLDECSIPPYPVAVEIASQIAEALIEAHSRPTPIIHRDLKPANIFVIKGPHGRLEIKVGDFGIAKVLGGQSSLLTDIAAVLGTPRYMAPEQWGGGDVDPRTDLYALGGIIYELLSGKPPFNATDGPPSLMYQHLHALPPPLPSTVPPALNSLVLQLLRKAKEERPESASEVHRALLAVAGLGNDEGSRTRTTILRSRDPLLNANPAGKAAPLARRALGIAAVLAVGLVGGAVVMVRPLVRTPTTVVSNTEQQARQSADFQIDSHTTPSNRSDVTPHGPKDTATRDRLLHRALNQETENNLTSPTGNNAAETYLIILENWPEEPQALAGIGRIKEKYLDWARKAESTGRISSALNYYEKALSVDPEDVDTSLRLQTLKKGLAGKTIAKVDRGMILVPSGLFAMGCDRDRDDRCSPNEKSVTKMALGEFHIDRLEVTVAEYRTCVEANSCSVAGVSTPYSHGIENQERAWACNWQYPERNNHPMNCIDWFQAAQYCAWVGKRLASEAEWEKSARGTDGRKYPWGDASLEGNSERLANVADKALSERIPSTTVIRDYDDGYAITAPVGSFAKGASPYGVLDLTGNVWEWVADWYDNTRRGRSVRGGAWNSTSGYLRASYRRWSGPKSRFEDVGFRCARDSGGGREPDQARNP